MKKLNNKGMTSIEVLLSFVVVVMIATSMYSTVIAYQNKQQIESFKEKIMTYKNLLTKEVNDDLIKKGLIAVDVVEENTNGSVYKITFTLKNGQKKRMIITNRKASEDGSGIAAANDKDDKFVIAYGDVGNEVEYDIPNLGYSTNDNGKKVYDLRINTVEISTDDGVFSLLVGFVHPDLESRYNITIVCPINF